jgi:quaternary ammonium compound-resistance protein SugE
VLDYITKFELINEKKMYWIYLLIAGIFEMGWAIGLKYTEGLTKLAPSVITVIAMILSFVFLSFAVKGIPLGTAYAVWTGIGTVGTAIAGILLFGEPIAVIRILCIVLIITGIVGLKLLS